jgi:hypothetical protein
VASPLQPWTKTGTIPVGLQSDDTFDVQNRTIRLHTCSLSNATRPLADPRPCWIGVIRRGASEGVTVALGSCSQYNDFIYNFPQEFIIGPEDVLTLSVRGDSGDAYKVKLLYTVVQLG